jgi:hypothetical protein
MLILVLAVAPLVYCCLDPTARKAHVLGLETTSKSQCSLYLIDRNILTKFNASRPRSFAAVVVLWEKSAQKVGTSLEMLALTLNSYGCTMKHNRGKSSCPEVSYLRF